MHLEVSNASQSCTRSDHSNSKDNLRNWRRFVYLAWVVRIIQKHPHFLEAEKKLPCNAASAAMVQVGGWQKVLGTEKKG